MNTLFVERTGTYYTSIENLKYVVQWFKNNDTGRVPTGIWSNFFWDRHMFMRWFHRCLNEKINRNYNNSGRKYTQEWQSDMRHDSIIINDYANRIRRSGRNILCTKEMKSKYPHVNSQTPEEY